MNKLTTTLIGIGAIAAGASLVVVGDRAGWFDPSANSSNATARHDHDHDHDPASQAASPGATVRIVEHSQTPRALRAPSPGCQTAQALVEFASADVARKAGLRTVAVQAQPAANSLQCPATIEFNGDRLAHITPRTAGVVQRVVARLGDQVSAGDVLIEINSVELASAKAEYLSARALAELWQNNIARQEELASSGIIAAGDARLQEARSKIAQASVDLSRAAQRLRNLGLTSTQLEELAAAEASHAAGAADSSLLAVRAPFAGTVVDRHAVVGEAVDATHVLFTIADTSTMWAIMDIYEADASSIALGQTVALEFGTPALRAGSTAPITGKISWISPQVDPRTRTLKARAELDNTKEGGIALRANMIGRASIAVDDDQDSLVVPKQSVQWEGCCNIVFVKASETIYQPKVVKLGRQIGDFYIVEDGLAAGDLAVTAGSYLLKTELLKESIGAGCCEH